MIPVKELPVVAHVGSFDPSLKGIGSYEGSGLSVSLHPASWARIARLGTDGCLLVGRGRFVDMLALSETQKSAIEQWGMDEGLCERTEAFTVTYFDEEDECDRSFEVATRAEAVGEAEEYEDARIDPVEALSPTVALAERSNHDPRRLDRMGSDLVFDLVAMAFFERDPTADGVWWDEDFDPGRLSAPRGAIFPSRLGEFTRMEVSWAELLVFEDSDEKKDFMPDGVSATLALR